MERMSLKGFTSVGSPRGAYGLRKPASPDTIRIARHVYKNQAKHKLPSACIRIGVDVMQVSGFRIGDRIDWRLDEDKKHSLIILDPERGRWTLCTDRGPTRNYERRVLAANFTASLVPEIDRVLFPTASNTIITVSDWVAIKDDGRPGILFALPPRLMQTHPGGA